MNTDDRKWEIIESEYLIRRPWLTARRDRVKLPTGVEIPEYYILEYPDWVNVIAITKEGKFVLVRQYRHGIKETRYEICAGVWPNRHSRKWSINWGTGKSRPFFGSVFIMKNLVA